MHPTDRRQFRQGFWATTLATLASRVLGMLCDATIANLLGLAAGGVMDAFVVAFRIANLSRRLLGEGALATSYLPVLAAELERDRQAAICLAAIGVDAIGRRVDTSGPGGRSDLGLLWIGGRDRATAIADGFHCRHAPLPLVYLFGGTTVGHVQRG